MEIINVIIFVQSFVWATFLLKKQLFQGKRAILGFAFFMLSLLYMIYYSIMAFSLDINEQVIAFVIILTFQLFGLYQYKSIFKNISSNLYFVWKVLNISISLIVLLFILILNPINWIVLIVMGIFLNSFDWYLFITWTKERALLGYFVENSSQKLNFVILLYKSFCLIYSLGIFLFINDTEIISTAISISHCILGVMVFVAGHLAITIIFKEVYRERKINNSRRKSSDLTEKIERLMQDEKPYLDCELTLEKMAKMLNVRENELTTSLNTDMGINFYKLINDYRIQTVKQKLNKFDNRKYTIMASAYESGFSSKSSFYRIFKEYTNMTPKEFMRINR
ncbi:MAG: helix-turn-helix transcriptional regulator [Bacteroidales bacterium]|nr:helix-turn-helix transcriptional regulator [Bacteroidales bacterium]